MTTRRYAITPTKSPQLTGGDDRPETPCQKDMARRIELRDLTGVFDPPPFDVLIDATAGPAFHAALHKATKLCRSCPIEVATKCFTENAEESWVQAIKTAKNPPRDRPECGTNWGVRKHGHAKESACEKCKVFMRAKTARRKARKDAEAAA